MPAGALQESIETPRQCSQWLPYPAVEIERKHGGLIRIGLFGAAGKRSVRIRVNATAVWRTDDRLYRLTAADRRERQVRQR